MKNKPIHIQKDMLPEPSAHSLVRAINIEGWPLESPTSWATDGEMRNESLSFGGEGTPPILPSPHLRIPTVYYNTVPSVQ